MSDLNPQQFSWMRSEPVRALFAAFPKGSLRFVGGCVRNALLGVDVADIDLATTLEPSDVVAAPWLVSRPIGRRTLSAAT